MKKIYLSRFCVGALLLLGAAAENDVVAENIVVYTVTFNSQGGSAVPPHEVAPGAKDTLPTPPTRTGYTFAGWYREANCTTAWDFDTSTVAANVTLYAAWVQNSANIKPVNANKWQIHPNPTANVVYFTNPNSTEVNLYNLSGEWLQRSYESQIDLSERPNAMYLLQIGARTVKVIKK